MATVAAVVTMAAATVIPMKKKKHIQTAIVIADLIISRIRGE